MKKYTNIAAVWLRKDKNGQTFISFKAEVDIKAGESIALFKNDKGDNEKRPDYRAYTVEETEPTGPSQENLGDVSNDVPF